MPMGVVSRMDLNTLLLHAIELGASDVHLKVGQPPILRHDGDLSPMDGIATLEENHLEGILDIVTRSNPARRSQFDETGDLDISYSISGRRFRVNGFRQRGSISFAFRVIPADVPNFEVLGLPSGVARLANEHRGLVLVTGATGSGKTTTLAAMLDHINRSRRQHIVTIEDPIEILHPDHSCIVNQREVGLDTESFQQALRRVLRQDPDVILIGELRDTETAFTAIQAAESGHLVFGTLHTQDAPQSIDRIIDVFPPHQQQQVRVQLASALQGICTQQLIPTTDGQGRAIACEVMVATPAVAAPSPPRSWSRRLPSAT
jgi:twitching motility protein PilT